MSSSSFDGHNGDDHVLMDESVSDLEFYDCLEDFGEQSPVAQSNPLARSFSMNAGGQEALIIIEMVLGLLKEQKREKDRRIEELELEIDELNEEIIDELEEEIRELKTERGQMNQRIESLQRVKQAVENELGKANEELEKCVKRIGELEAQVLEANNQMELQKEKLFFVESEDVHQELRNETTELDGSISTLNDARQKNIDLQHQNTAQQKEVNRRLIRNEEFVEALLPRFQFKPDEYYMQYAATNHFLALQVRHLLLDDTQRLIPTFTGLIRLVQHQDGSTALYSSLNDMRLKVDNSGEIVTISHKEKEADKEFEDFELFRAGGNKSGQLIIRSIQTKKFVRVSESLRLCADVVNPFYASKFVLKSSAMHLPMVERYLQPNVDYFLIDPSRLSNEDSSKYCFIGIKNNPTWTELVLTSEANKEPLKIVYNSDRTISFSFQLSTKRNGACWHEQNGSDTDTKWLRTCNDSVFLDIEAATKFEPLIGPDECDGIALRTVQCWDNLYANYGYIKGSRDKATKFMFLPVN